jgi:hypothetical protein
MRLPPGDIERLVVARVQALQEDQAALFGIIQTYTTSGGEQMALLDLAAMLAKAWRDQLSAERRGTLIRLVDRIVVARAQPELHVKPSRLIESLNPSATPERLSQNRWLGQHSHETTVVPAQATTL